LNRKLFVRGLQLALRASVGGGTAIALAQALELEYPVYSFVAAVIVTDLSPSETRNLGLRRVGATLLGAALGATLSPHMPPAAWSIAVGVGSAIFLSHLARAQDGAKVAGYICGLVMLYEGRDPWEYALHRTIETMLGVGVAWVISLIPKLLRVKDDVAPSA
jgi:uncharacterized membrane protein YgaE (UPF0421/DUF939 family)